MFVVDASVLIDALLGIPAATASVKDRQLHAPVTIDIEVMHALRRRWFAGQVRDDAVTAVIKMFERTPITRHAMQPFVERIWSLRHNITAYDAAYVALAESLNLPLLTRDWRLAHSSAHTAAIEYIA
jgi:predicted nucleic acid-binding protein